MDLSHIWHDVFLPVVKISAEFPINFCINVLWTQVDKFYPDLHSAKAKRDAKYNPTAICQKVTCCDVSACHQYTAAVKTNITVIPKHLFKATTLTLNLCLVFTSEKH